MTDMVKSLAVAVSTLVKRLGIAQSTLVSALGLDFPSGGAVESFNETFGAVDVQNSLQKGDAVANTDEGNWVVSGYSVHSSDEVNTVNGMCEIESLYGNADRYAGLTQNGLSTTKLNGTYPQCVVDLDNGAARSHMIKFYNSSTLICSVRLALDTRGTVTAGITDNKANNYAYPGGTAWGDRLDYQFTFDFTAHTFSLSVDGNAVFSGIAFESNVSSFDEVDNEKWDNKTSDLFGMKCGSGLF